MIRNRPWAPPALVLATCVLPAVATAQEVAGVALGPHGEPLADVVVALHRVGEVGGGAHVASVTTDTDGRFHFDVQVPDSALYFAAMRYTDRMYIGPPAMGGVERVTDYVLAVDPAAEAGAVASALSGQIGGSGGTGGTAAMGAAMPRGAASASAAGGDERALWLVALIALTAAGLFITTAPRYRRRRTRDALIEVATVENRLAGDPSDQERQELLRRRHRLRERLAPPA